MSPPLTIDDDTAPPGHSIRRSSDIQITRLQEQLSGLKDFIGLKLTSERELLDARWQADMKALKIGSDELARRLDVLNHAHAEAIRVQLTYIPRETFAVALDQVRLKQDDNVLRISALETAIATKVIASTTHFGRTATVIGLVVGLPGLLLAIIALVLKLVP